MNILNLQIGQQIRELNRLRHIAEILIRNGLGMLLDQTELARLLPGGWRRRAEKADEQLRRMSIPERVRHTLEDLGPTYIKLGQILSGRGDLLPAGYIEELTKLLDSAPAFPYEDAAKQIEIELGKPPEAVFAVFEQIPIAAASIGQVHRATLPNGDRVVVKVQRPDIEKIVRSDLDLLMRQARFLEKRSEVARNYNLVENIEEMSYTLMNELDYVAEAQNIDRFHQGYASYPNLHIPRVYREYTTKRVIVMEEVEGIQLTDLDRVRQEGYDLSAIAEIGTDFYLRQIFEDGFFHADPHPANLMVSGNRIAILDFGMVAFLSQQLREDLGDMLVGVITQNTQQVITVMVRMGIITRATSLRELERDLSRMLVRHLGLPLHQMDIGRILGEILSLSFMHHVRLPSDFALLIRTIIILNSLGQNLDPDYKLVPALDPFVRQLVKDKLSVRRIGANTIRTFESLNTLAQRLPNRLDDLWDQLDEGNLTVGVSVRDLRMIIQRVDRIANRLAFALIVASLIIGSALILMGGTAIQTLFQIPWLNMSIPVAQVAFILAGLAGTWLMWSIVRSRGM
ncbi:MAG: AarF/ABC1/UbiB kinase family protein [Anaerolineae bacterium]|nr:AarF/ABC1/UbiB kinase family protein [Anaerolineae bacterium]